MSADLNLFLFAVLAFGFALYLVHDKDNWRR